MATGVVRAVLRLAALYLVAWLGLAARLRRERPLAVTLAGEPARRSGKDRRLTAHQW
jgi:hypothetical protein